jgi:hypothetical protein
MRCGRCKKRFRLSTALAATEEEPAPRRERRTYRKRISHSAMRRVTEDEAKARADGGGADQRPGELVDDMALALEQALRERRHLSDPSLTATEAELPMEEDVEGDAHAGSESSKPEKRTTPRVFRFTPPPVAQEILFRAAGKRRTTKPLAEALQEATPDEVQEGPTAESAKGASTASRSAWLDFIDAPLAELTPEPRESVAALRWLLAEDTLAES